MFDGDEIIDFHINDAYAAKYESRKRGEELSMRKKAMCREREREITYNLTCQTNDALVKEKYGDDVMESTRLRQLFVEGGHDADTFSGARGGYSDESSSDDEEEDEVGELVTPEVDAQILTTISKIRRKDPVVYDASKNFFSGKISIQFKWRGRTCTLRKCWLTREEDLLTHLFICHHSKEQEMETARQAWEKKQTELKVSQGMQE